MCQFFKIPEKIDKICQTDEIKQQQSLNHHLDFAKNQEEVKMQILHEKNNHHQLHYDQVTIATLQKSVQQLMETKVFDQL